MLRAALRRVLLRYARLAEAESRAETQAFLHQELEALRAELQAERATFIHALEQMRQANETHRRHEFEQTQQLAGESGITRLVETLDAALLTLVMSSNCD